MSLSFSQLLRQTRREKGYSQRDLAAKVKVDYTYLSKLENNRAEYPPKEEVIRALAYHLELDAEELIYLAGRITLNDAKIIQELAKTYGNKMPVLLRQMRDNPDLAQKLIQEEKKKEN